MVIEWLIEHLAVEVAGGLGVESGNASGEGGLDALCLGWVADDLSMTPGRQGMTPHVTLCHLSYSQGFWPSSIFLMIEALSLIRSA